MVAGVEAASGSVSASASAFRTGNRNVTRKLRALPVFQWGTTYVRRATKICRALSDPFQKCDLKGRQASARLVCAE